MDRSDFLIPRKLDAPKLLLLWHLDSAFIVIVILLLFSMLNMVPVAIFLAYVVGKGYSYLKEEGGKGLLIKFMYWFLPTPFSKRFPSYIREYFGG